MSTKPTSWSCKEVCAWVHNKFPEYEDNFGAQKIAGIDLVTLTQDELKNDLHITPLGHRKMILREIEELKGNLECHNFEVLLKRAGMCQPERKVMNKLYLHMAAQVNAISSSGRPELAHHLYELGKQLIGTSTKIQIQHSINVSIRGPLNLDLYGPKILSGADAEGRPVIIKLVLSPESTEINAIRALKLDSPNNLPLVHSQIHSTPIQRNDSQILCILMPHYPTSVALMPQLPAKVLLAGANTIQSGLEYIHSSNYCHLDVKPANIFVDTKGNWILGDFDTTVPKQTPVIGHTNPYILRDFKGLPALPAMDYYMLATTILTESDKTGTNNIYSRIRGSDGFAVHSHVLQEVDRMGDADLKAKVQHLLKMAEDICGL